MLSVVGCRGVFPTQNQFRLLLPRSGELEGGLSSRAALGEDDDDDHNEEEDLFLPSPEMVKRMVATANAQYFDWLAAAVPAHRSVRSPNMGERSVSVGPGDLDTISEVSSRLPTPSVHGSCPGLVPPDESLERALQGGLRYHGVFCARALSLSIYVCVTHTLYPSCFLCCLL